MFTVLILALLLSCVVTYTNSQYPILFDVPTNLEYQEASTVNSFKRPASRQFSGQNNVLQSPLQRPGFNPDFFFNANHFNGGFRPQIYQQSQPQQQQPPPPSPPNFSGEPLPNYSGLSNKPPGVRPSPQASSPTTLNPSYQQTTASRPAVARPSKPIQLQKGNNFAPVTAFAWQLFRNTAGNEGQNLVSCPLSSQLLLSYMVSGSEGDTQQELINAVGYQGPVALNRLIQSMLRSGENRELQMATSFFVSEKIRLNPNFMQSATENDVQIIRTNFNNPEGFSQEYNQWARSKTKGVYRPVRVSFAPNTKMVLSSAVYFKGEWIFKFNPAQVGTFYSAPGSPVSTNMMTLRRKLQYGTLNNMAEWVSIPYNSSDSMIVILPSQGYRLDDLIRSMRISDLFDSLNEENYANVNLTLPKFKIDSKVSLIEPLQRMGVKKVFSPTSEITRMAEGEQMHISNALQQASLEVNEEGSVASSLTSFSVVALSFTPPIPDINFTVDRPFIAMIVDRRNHFPFFIAKVVTPQ